MKLLGTGHVVTEHRRAPKEEHEFHMGGGAQARSSRMSACWPSEQREGLS